MVKYKAHIYFLLIMCCYFGVRLIRLEFEDLPHFVRFYLTDLLFVPAMALFALIAVRFFKRNPELKISPILVFVQVILVSIYFEWYLPNYSTKEHWYTADAWDILMYAIGGVAFLGLQRAL